MSAYRRLFIWVEGADDERFFRSVVGPQFEKQYGSVSVVSYAGRTIDYVNNFLRSISAMPADYIFVADIDNSPCVTSKKAALTARYKHLNPAKVIVVKAEIESWYRAGLNPAACVRFRMRPLSDTQAVTKEHFHATKPNGFQSGIDYMIEVLKHFKIEVARSQNQSFAYFADKYNLST